MFGYFESGVFNKKGDYIFNRYLLQYLETNKTLNT